VDRRRRAVCQCHHAAGLSDRVTVDVLSRKDQPSSSQLAQTEALLAWGAPPGLLPRMPALRWAQALTAGVEGWLALPDLPVGLTLTCAAAPTRIDAGEYPRRSVLSDQTVRGLRRGPATLQMVRASPPR